MQSFCLKHPISLLEVLVDHLILHVDFEQTHLVVIQDQELIRVSRIK